MGMIKEIVKEAWIALQRSRVRSVLTMLGIVWGIAAVTLLISYGDGFRNVLVTAFEAFGRDAVVCWPQATSEQPGGQRAGKVVHFEQEDVDLIRSNVSVVKNVCLESVRWKTISYQDTMANTAIRGVCPVYGEMRNEVPSVADGSMRRTWWSGGAWCSSVSGFITSCSREEPATGEEVRIDGVRFTVIGVMDRKMQLSNYFTSDDESAFIPYSAASDLWDTRYASVLVFEPVDAIV